MYDDSTIGEGVVAWILFNLGVVPLILYTILYLHMELGRSWSPMTGFLRAKSLATFVVLGFIEFIVILIIVANLSKL